MAGPRIMSADSVTLLPLDPSPGAMTEANRPASGSVKSRTGTATTPSPAANSRAVRRAAGSMRSGTDVRRRLWLKTPNVVYTANAMKKPSVCSVAPKRLR